jgi:hypothetical protein
MYLTRYCKRLERLVRIQAALLLLLIVAAGRSFRAAPDGTFNSIMSLGIPSLPMAATNTLQAFVRHGSGSVNITGHLNVYRRSP